MPHSFPSPVRARLLVAESETNQARRKRRRSTGRSSGETYVDLLRSLMPNAICELVRPIETGPDSETALPLDGYDAVFLTGSPLHVYEDSPAVRRQVDFMRAVFGAGTPSFGSCAGLQVAVVAAGGTVRENRRGHEVAFARRILRTEPGRHHPLLAGRPDVFDAPAIHSDEVEMLPHRGATLLATNTVTAVQAVEIKVGTAVFWGVQYHPELPLSEIADALRRQAADIIEQGLVRDEAGVENYAATIDALDRDPARRDLAWRLGIDHQVTDAALRQTELRNFLSLLVEPNQSIRSRA